MMAKPEGKKSVYLNLTEENFVPDAVTANDPTADLSTFSLSGKVKQPTLEWGVRLAEDLQERKQQRFWLARIYLHFPETSHTSPILKLALHGS